MDWKLAREEEQAVLKRIVALLFALADLAELACGRSRIVRGLVLWILLPAEALARDLVGAPAAVPFSRTGDSPADAMRLAGNLRYLARELVRELDRRATLAFAVHGDGIGQEGAALAELRSLADALALLAPARTSLLSADPPDTS